MLRVLYVLDEFEDSMAGTEVQFLELVAGVRARGADVSVALLRNAPALERALPGVPMTVLGLKSLRAPGALGALWRLVRWARAHGSHLAHVFFNDASIACPLPLRLAGVPVIVSRRDLGFWYTAGNLRLLRFNRHAVAAVVANAEAVKRQVMSKEGYPANKVVTIYNAWREHPAAHDRVGTRRELGIPAHSPMLLIVANLRPLKRIDDALRILALASESVPDIWLCIVGADRPGAGGSEVARLRAVAAELGVEQRVVFTGPRKDPWPIVQACDIGLLCSETEGLSNALIEYSAAGRPVVCSDAGGNPEVVADGVSGYVYRTGDVRYAADRVIELLTHGARAATLGAAGQRRVVEQFGRERMVESHLSLYRALANGSTG